MEAEAAAEAAALSPAGAPAVVAAGAADPSAAPAAGAGISSYRTASHTANTAMVVLRCAAGSEPAGTVFTSPAAAAASACSRETVLAVPVAVTLAAVHRVSGADAARLFPLALVFACERALINHSVRGLRHRL